MNWKPLNDLEQIKGIDASSHQNAVLIFKHSTRCTISSMVLNRLEREWDAITSKEQPIFLLDLIRHRAVSNALTVHYGIEHESPQVLVIRNGRCVYNSSHTDIAYDDVMEELVP